MRFCDTDALATGQSRGYSPNVSFLARPFSHATGQEQPVATDGFPVACPRTASDQRMVRVTLV